MAHQQLKQSSRSVALRGKLHATGYSRLAVVEPPAFEGGELFQEPLPTERASLCNKLREAIVAVLMMMATLAWIGS